MVIYANFSCNMNYGYLDSGLFVCNVRQLYTKWLRFIKLCNGKNGKCWNRFTATCTKHKSVFYHVSISFDSHDISCSFASKVDVRPSFSCSSHFFFSYRFWFRCCCCCCVEWWTLVMLFKFMIHCWSCTDSLSDIPL